MPRFRPFCDCLLSGFSFPFLFRSLPRNVARIVQAEKDHDCAQISQYRKSWNVIRSLTSSKTNCHGRPPGQDPAQTFHIALRITIQQYRNFVVEL